MDYSNLQTDNSRTIKGILPIRYLSHQMRDVVPKALYYGGLQVATTSITSAGVQIFNSSPSPAIGRYESGGSEGRNPMAITMKRVADLIEKDSDYDESFIKPNEESYSLVRRVLENLKQYFPAEICNASPAAIGDGGIFIEWGSADNYVRLIVPPDPRQAYLYCRSGSEKKTTREVSSATLAEFLEWMIRHERSRAEKE